tara:strand:+ start:2676 stop:2885 length:210 start_codon:yes stop_codon:yes gene_type:complete
MTWYTFVFGFVTGLCSVFMVGGCFFYVHLRPYMKSAKVKRTKSENEITPEMWLRDAAGLSSTKRKRGGK